MCSLQKLPGAWYLIFSFNVAIEIQKLQLIALTQVFEGEANVGSMSKLSKQTFKRFLSLWKPNPRRPGMLFFIVLEESLQPGRTGSS